MHRVCLDVGGGRVGAGPQVSRRSTHDHKWRCARAAVCTGAARVAACAVTGSGVHGQWRRARVAATARAWAVAVHGQQRRARVVAACMGRGAHGLWCAGRALLARARPVHRHTPRLLRTTQRLRRCRPWSPRRPLPGSRLQHIWPTCRSCPVCGCGHGCGCGRAGAQRLAKATACHAQVRAELAGVQCHTAKPAWRADAARHAGCAGRRRLQGRVADTPAAHLVVDLVEVVVVP